MAEEAVTNYWNVAHLASRKEWFRLLAEEMLDPELDLILQQSPRHDIYDRLCDRDPDVAGAFDSLFAPILGCDWTVVPAEGDNRQEAVDRAAEVTTLIRRSPGWRKVVASVLQVIPRGYGGVELHGPIGGFGDIHNGQPLFPLEDRAPDGRRMAPTEIPARALMFDRDGRPRFRTKAHPIHGESLWDPKYRYKFFYATWGRTEGGHYFGTGMALRIYWLYVIKSANFRDWASGNERLGNEIPTYELTKGNQVKVRAAMRKALKETVANGGHLLLPPGVKRVQDLGSRTRFDSFGHLDERSREILHKAIRGNELTANSGNSTALAQARVHRLVDTDHQWKALLWTEDSLVPLIAAIEDFKYGNRLGLRPRCESISDEAQEETLARLDRAADYGLEVPTKWLYEQLQVPLPKEAPATTQLQRGGGLAAAAGLGGASFPGFGTRKFGETAGALEEELRDLAGLTDTMRSAIARTLARRLTDDVRDRVAAGAGKRRGSP